MKFPRSFVVNPAEAEGHGSSFSTGDLDVRMHMVRWSNESTDAALCCLLNSEKTYEFPFNKENFMFGASNLQEISERWLPLRQSQASRVIQPRLSGPVVFIGRLVFQVDVSGSFALVGIRISANQAPAGAGLERCPLQDFTRENGVTILHILSEIEG